MRVCSIALLGIALAGCGNAPQAGARHDSRPVAASEFPKAGDYHIIRDRTEGGQLKREESDMWIDASNRQAFEELVARDGGSRCRDRQVDVSGGSFSVKMTCDAPDGDIHNIGMEAHGTYSRDSIDVDSQITLWGTPIRESASYRLRNQG